MAENAEDKRIKIVSTCIGGVLAVPTSLLLRNTNPKLWIPLMLFAGALFSLMLKTFIEQALKNVTLRICIFRSIRAGVYFIVGAAVPMAIGLLVPTRAFRIPFSVLVTALVTAFALLLWRGQGENQRETEVHLWVIWLLVMVTMAGQTGFADLAQWI